MKANRSMSMISTRLRGFPRRGGMTLVALGLALGASGCDDGFLDRNPLDTISDESYWQTENHLVLAANGVYGYLKAKNTVDMENLADNTVWPTMTQYRQISTGHYEYDLSTFNTEWAVQYDGIRRANHFLENYEQAQASQEIKDRLAGEVRFIRAYLYFYLTELFGDVPFVTTTIDPDDEVVYGGRDSREMIVDWMLQELTEIAPHLPISYPQEEYGRITRGAALALKARIALYNQRWEVAEEAARQVMDLGYYELYSNGDPESSYRELFTYEGRASRNSSNRESILVRTHLMDVSQHNLSREIWVPDQAIRWNPTQSLVDSYLMIDGRPIERSPLYQVEEYEDLWENRDPRMAQTILRPGSPWEGRMDGRPANDGIFMVPKWTNDRQGAVTVTGYYFHKYVEPSTVGMVGKDENDIVILRYAEVLLTWAEARLEQGKLTQADLDESVNLLRARVGMHPMRISELQSWGLDLREELRRERRVELALEGQRPFDIKRWRRGDLLVEPKRGINIAWAHDPDALANQQLDADGFVVVSDGHVFEEKHYLWPIPMTQLDRNPNLGQNPGW